MSFHCRYIGCQPVNLRGAIRNNVAYALVYCVPDLGRGGVKSAGR